MVTEEQRFNGTSRQEPERVLALCDDPAVIVRDELKAAEGDGCKVGVVASNEYGVSYGGTCNPVRPDGTKDFTLSVDSDKSDEFRMRRILPNGMITTSGSWLKDCPASGTSRGKK